MIRNQKGAGRAEPLSALDEAAPPPVPTPMPRQNLVFWTPRRLLSACLRAVSELRHPQPKMQHAPVSVKNADEPR
jgi:hypothetical protein